MSMDHENLMTQIISAMKSQIIADLSTGRVDRGLNVFSAEEIDDFIYDFKNQIAQAADEMYEAYQDDDELHLLTIDDLPKLIREFLYEYVDTTDVEIQ